MKSSQAVNNPPHHSPWAARVIQRVISMFGCIPDSFIATLGRFSIAAVFWKSGQTKIEGLAIDLIGGQFQLGWPHVTAAAVQLFQYEYKLPLIPPDIAATLAASAESVFSVLLLLGLATRFSALALLGMTLVIEIFVYPDAYPVHGVWATVLLFLIAKGPGKLSVDYWIARRCGVAR